MGHFWMELSVPPIGAISNQATACLYCLLLNAESSFGRELKTERLKSDWASP
jgi:hypothetical protein